MDASVRCRWALIILLLPVAFVGGSAAPSGERLPLEAPDVVAWWTLSSAAKTQPVSAPPTHPGDRIHLHCARNESEAACVFLRAERPLNEFRISVSDLTGPEGSVLPGSRFDLLQVHYLNVTRATDKHSQAGLWPDPLVPIESPLALGAGTNHAFWLRVLLPKDTRPGAYTGTVHLSAEGFSADLPLELVAFNFTLPDRMTCVTAFGFSPAEVFRYHGLKTEEHKRIVLDRYFANLSAHHVSPYDPAPLDHFKVRWPDVRPPRSHWDDWTGLRIVTNEVHSGAGALLINDDQPGANVSAEYQPLIPIPTRGLRFRGWFRTPVPGHRFLISFTHYDANRQWMSGRNRDLTFRGTGAWQTVDETLTQFPEGAAFVRVHLRATLWSDRGEHLGLVWFDDLSLTDGDTGRELLPGGDFESKPRTEPIAPRETLRAQFDFQDWDRAMERAMNVYHFNSFKVSFPGLGGGTFHEIAPPNLLGFREEDPEYPLLLDSYGRQLEEHLRARGWLGNAYVYWFDEPDPDQYPFVMNGFAKLKRHAPGIARMLTEQVEPGLVGGPNLWCPISDHFQLKPAEERRRQGDKFWWYVCTGPKAPYAGLFIDHPAPEMRIWVWQTWQRGIDGLLVWQINYWNSPEAYPDPAKPQNPYEDPMSWTTGYSTPSGQRLPWGNGDGRFIYPPKAAASANTAEPVLAGPVDSIRWEHLRDGIEDYEYLSILRRELERTKAKLSPAEAADLAKLLEVPDSINRSMTEFTPDGGPIEAQRRELGEAIERLQRVH